MAALVGLAWNARPRQPVRRGRPLVALSTATHVAQVFPDGSSGSEPGTSGIRSTGPNVRAFATGAFLKPPLGACIVQAIDRLRRARLSRRGERRPFVCDFQA